MLPSVRVMANDLKISFLTVKKAYDELEKEGYSKENIEQITSKNFLRVANSVWE